MGFTKKEKNFILKNYNDLSISKIAEILNCSEKQISSFLISQDISVLKKEKKSFSKLKENIIGEFEYKSIKQVFLENLTFWISVFVLIFLLFFRSFGSILLSDELTMYNDFLKGNINWLNLIYGSSSNHYWAYLLFGYAPWGNRFISLLLHLVNLVVFFTLFRNFFSEKILKIAVLLISVHSLIVEPITWVAANPYVYHGFIYLLIAYFSFLYEKKNNYLYLFIYYVLILNLTLTGGHTNYAPFFAIAFNLFILKRSLKKEAILSFWLILIIPYYALTNRSLVESRVASLTTGPYLEKFTQTLPFTTAKSLEIVFFPYNLALFHEETLTPIYYAFARLFTIFFFGFVVYLFFRKEKIYFGLVAVALASCIYLFSPIQIAWFVAERYMYFSVFIACLFLALFVNYLNNKISNLGNLFFASYFLLFLFVTFFRFDAWSDMAKLWEENIKISPDSYRVRNNLAESYTKSQQFDKAVEQYQNAIRINPNFVEAYFNLSNAYLMQSKLSDAEAYLKISIEMNPSLLEAYIRLAIIKGSQNDFSSAYGYVEKAREIDPKSDMINKFVEELKKYEAQQKN
jgi:tetratricopeptide (TPR) repeat protein